MRTALAAANVFNIVATTHAQRVVENVWKFEGKIGSVISSQATPGQANFNIRHAAIKANNRHQIVENEILIGVVTQTAPVEVGAVVEPGFMVDAFRAVNFYSAGLDQVSNGPDHAVILKIIKLAAAGRKGDNRRAIMSKRQNLDVAPKGRAVDFFVASEHR